MLRLVASVLGVCIAAGSTGACAEVPPGTGVLRYAFPIAETGFDPAQVSTCTRTSSRPNVFDTPLTYDYLARPVKVVPNTAEALPEISPDGLTWTLRIKKGIYFTDDPAFGGKRRELVAAGLSSTASSASTTRSWKSPQLYTVEGFIVGMDEHARAGA